MERYAHITGWGRYAPERVLTNGDLERMVDTSDEWIVSRTGIRERRVAAAHETTASMGAVASLRAGSRVITRPFQSTRSGDGSATREGACRAEMAATASARRLEVRRGPGTPYSSGSHRSTAVDDRRRGHPLAHAGRRRSRVPRPDPSRNGHPGSLRPAGRRTGFSDQVVDRAPRGVGGGSS